MSDRARPRYIDYFPKPLLDDLIAKRWLPIIGAGLSHNAKTPEGARPPLWHELGQLVAAQIDGYQFSTPMDALSTYCHLYRMPLLAQLLAKLLLVHKARPGKVHGGLALLPFDTIVTTNVDFLLEKSYDRTEYTRVLMDDTDLSVAPHDTGVVNILKIHGDVHNPEHLVVTEDAYDEFLVRYPILATVLANLLVERTAVLIGYSMEDPDLRQVWQIVRARLGSLSRPAFAIRVDATVTEVDRFKRRNISVINLPSKSLTDAEVANKSPEEIQASRYAQVLEDVFLELNNYQREKILAASRIHEESVHKQSLIPLGQRTRLCLFAVPSPFHSFYKEFVFPEVVRAGLVPVVEEDIESPGGNIPAEIDALLVRACAVFIHADDTTPTTAFEMRLTKTSGIEHVFAVVQPDLRGLGSLRPSKVFEYKSDQELFDKADLLAKEARAWFEGVASIIQAELDGLPETLLELDPDDPSPKDFAPALVAAYTNLEAVLARVIDEPGERPVPLWTLIRRADRRLHFDKKLLEEMDPWWRDMLRILHNGKTYGDADEVRSIVSRVRQVSMDIERRDIERRDLESRDLEANQKRSRSPESRATIADSETPLVP